eukprot:5061912-Pyramimonas_sp.AAC.1
MALGLEARLIRETADVLKRRCSAIFRSQREMWDTPAVSSRSANMSRNIRGCRPNHALHGAAPR